tara:strand:- start:853 stop:1020 length:168 start_codon:yes stop_codon:yes gene_type:complete
MNKGTFRFNYTEIVGKNTEVSTSLIIETRDVIRSIKVFGEGRRLAKLVVIEVSNQ